MTNGERKSAALRIIQAIAEAIREAGKIPSGHLYAVLMEKGITIEQYENIIGLLKRTGLVKESASVLIWVGGQ
jgi:hypothetical protein